MSNETLQIGLIGTGAIGRTHIERINNTLQGGRVIAVSDAFAEAGRKAAATYGCEFIEDGEALINDSRISFLSLPLYTQGQLVFIGSPWCCHANNVQQKGGKSFYFMPGKFESDFWGEGRQNFILPLQIEIRDFYVLL